jgi:hypothetical protein
MPCSTNEEAQNEFSKLKPEMDTTPVIAMPTLYEL